MLAGVSGLVTGLASAKIITSIGPRSSLVLGLTGLALGLGLPGLWPTRVGLAVGLACTGLLILINVVTVTHRQRTVPIELLGRVTSAYRLIAFGCLPVGSRAGRSRRQIYLRLPQRAERCRPSPSSRPPSR